MRALIVVFVLGVALGFAVLPAGADEKNDRTGEMDAAARAFVKAYQAKDVDGMIAVADAPFAIGSLRNPKIMKTNADLRNELRRRMAPGEPLPTKAMRALTWDKAITKSLSAEEERRTREQLKPVMEITGPDGGYSALGDPVGKNKTAMSDTRLLVGIRDGKAKVLGIVTDR